MIVRILGEGQLRVDDSATDELNVLDAALEKAVNAGDEKAFRSALAALLDRVRSLGSPLAADAIEPSDLILPYSEASLDDVRGMMAGEGLIPGLGFPAEARALPGLRGNLQPRLRLCPDNNGVGRARGPGPRSPSALGIGQNGI